MSTLFHVDRPVVEFASFYAKLQPLLANFIAQPRGPCKPMLERFLIQHGPILEKAYAFESKILASQAFVWSIVYTINAHLTHVLPPSFPESRRWSVCDQPHSSWILTEAEKEIMMVAQAKILDVKLSAADVAKIFYPSINGVEPTDGQAEAPPTAGPAPNSTNLPTTRSRAPKGKGKADSSTPPPSTSQKHTKKPSFLESEDDELDQLEISPKVKSGAPGGSGKPPTGKGKTGGPRAKPKDPSVLPKDKKQARSPSPERTAPKPNKKSKKTADIAAPPPETSGVPKWGDPRLKLPGKWPKGQEGLVEQDPNNLADSKPHIRDDLDPEVYEGAEGQPFYLWKDVSSTIALPGGIRASLASLAHGAISIRFTGAYSRSLPCTECYEKPQECTGLSGTASKCDRCAAKRLACSNNLPENSLSAFLEVAAQNSMTSQTMIERTLTEIDFHREQIFDLDQAIIRLERLKKKTIMAHDIAQDTLKASCQDPRRIIHLLKTTDTTFKMTPAQIDMLIACLGWESVDFSVEASCTPEGDPMVRNLVEGRETVFLAPDSMTAVPKDPLSDPANLFSSEGDAQVAKSSDALPCRPIHLGGGFVVTERSEAPLDAPPATPFANPDIFVVGPTNLDTSLSEEGEIREAPAAEESG
ncbi:hypothetical protein L218DRAFT_1037803 [Marasmius fiardii PR-910]|nr:hypothetical protein L218DRAFT_1037803 [Marasmius fiardii PR-910]